MSVLISGSLAYDYIMAFPDTFKNHIMPDQIHVLSVSFVVDQLKKNLGGTSGNIAYTMNLLKTEPIILSALGSDAQDYLDHLQKHNITKDYITQTSDMLSSSAHITTDKDDNQITAFYPGAGGAELQHSLSDIKEDIDLVLISPNKKEHMIKHAKQAYEAGIPIVFDPGQQITALTPQEVALLVGQAKILIANDYEMKLIEQKTGWSGAELFQHVELVITTYGDKGSRIAEDEGSIDIPACNAQSVDDPTGAGDAYRAGFFAGYTRGFDLKTCGQMGSAAAVFAVEKHGTQNHSFTIDEFIQRYKDNFGEELELR